MDDYGSGRRVVGVQGALADPLSQRQNSEVFQGPTEAMLTMYLMREAKFMISKLETFRTNVKHDYEIRGVSEYSSSISVQHGKESLKDQARLVRLVLVDEPVSTVTPLLFLNGLFFPKSKTVGQNCSAILGIANRIRIEIVDMVLQSTIGSPNDLLDLQELIVAKTDILIGELSVYEHEMHH